MTMLKRFSVPSLLQKCRFDLWRELWKTSAIRLDRFYEDKPAPNGCPEAVVTVATVDNTNVGNLK